MRTTDDTAGLVIDHPERITSYFKKELYPLTLVTLSGLVYNVGLTAGPWFEGQLVQRLLEVTTGQKAFADMLTLALLYLLTLLGVEGARAIKRFFVRRFANDVSRSMRHMLYNQILHQNRSEIQHQQTGTLMTKAVTDVDACAEGMRKFTTEVFDTGVALLSYLAMLFGYDWRLALISCAFIPGAYWLAEKLKKLIYRYNHAYKKSAGALAQDTLDLTQNALTYRVYGCESSRAERYENALTDYEKKAVAANLWENTPQPIYQLITLAGVVLILYLGGKNVAGSGWTAWNLAAFTTFLACFSKMAVKASKAAKLFNAVQKAQVSWKRIQPLMKPYVKAEAEPAAHIEPKALEVTNLCFAYPDGAEILHNVSFSAKPGEIIGVTGPVACGKSTLGKAFLCESPYRGSIRIGGAELRELSPVDRSHAVCYMGHDPELLTDTLAENVRLGGNAPIAPVLEAVSMAQEVAQMPDGANTTVGSGGVQLSGGQQARLALARLLYHGGNVLVLDDPFSAVDRPTEEAITAELRTWAKDSIVLLLSHRVGQFPTFDQVLWMEDGACTVGTHESLMPTCAGYAQIYRAQTAGGDLDA